jgi:hypothetical protein
MARSAGSRTAGDRNQVLASSALAIFARMPFMRHLVHRSPGRKIIRHPVPRAARARNRTDPVEHDQRFTLPRELAPLALQNKKVLYDLLFHASAEALLEIAHDPRHLGAEIGFFSVLHSWDQRLQLHPHVHCVIAAGGLACDHSRWISSRRSFLLPIKVLTARRLHGTNPNHAAKPNDAKSCSCGQRAMMFVCLPNWTCKRCCIVSGIVGWGGERQSSTSSSPSCGPRGTRSRSRIMRMK